MSPGLDPEDLDINEEVSSVPVLEASASWYILKSFAVSS